MASFLLSSPQEKFPSSYTHILFTTTIAFLFSLFIFLFSRKSKSNGLNLPPGPPGWPIVGNLLQVVRTGKPFMHFVRDMIPIYGPIFTVKMGTRTLIIVSSANLAHEALVQKSQTFASRPRENPTRTIFSCNKFTVNAAVYGPVWRSLRRNMVSGMLSATRLREFHHVRKSAMDRLIERLRDEAKLSESTQSESTQGVVWVLANARFAVFCILLSMCFGIDMDEKTILTVERILRRVLIVTINPRIDDYIPFLRPLFRKQQKEAMEVREEQIKTLIPLINRRRSELENPDKKSAPFAYLDTLFDLKIEGRKSAPTDPELVTLCSEFINGGTDTTATAIEWAMARLIENPEIQAKLYQDIVTVVGNKKVGDKDVEKMLYLNAFTKELLRKHPPTYFSLTHAAVEPATLAGYDIPTDANLDFYIRHMSEDPKAWSDSARFDPERFVTGKEDADITGVKGITMIPFGAGRRICPGLSMATLHINLMVARLVQEFEWCALPTQRTIDFTDKFEFTVIMEKTLQAVIKPRKKLGVMDMTPVDGN
ncbi:cytochrome P450 77A2-like [Tasmannia lanceolata]|uniref:cytochrome P450 77A2-like n=1 Tax=Tasmannia lanceolata TaxID=3420 RepID=UPI00406373FD